MTHRPLTVSCLLLVLIFPGLPRARGGDPPRTPAARGVAVASAGASPPAAGGSGVPGGTAGEAASKAAGAADRGREGAGSGLEAALAALEADVTPGGIRMHLPADVSFDVNSCALRPEAGAALARVAEVIRAHPGRAVWVEGYTDFAGSQDYNKELSVKRAESVRRWLQAREGLQRTSFHVRGWGKTRPRATNRTEEGRRRNRRVEITIVTEP